MSERNELLERVRSVAWNARATKSEMQDTLEACECFLSRMQAEFELAEAIRAYVSDTIGER